MSIKELISHRLDTLSDTGDDKLFEDVCQICIKQIISHKKAVFKHTGNVYGGDGGVDGFILNEDYSHFRIAYSTRSDWQKKLREDASHPNASNYNGLFFCSSREINQRDVEKEINRLEEEYGYSIRIISKSILIDLMEDLPECLNLLEIPAELNRLEIEHLAKHNQFNSVLEILSRYIPRRIVHNDEDVSLLYDDKSVLLSDYVKKLPTVTVMLSPAGYGKTGAFKQVCNHILMNPEEYSLPPVYLKIPKYNPGTLYNKITDIVGHSPDYELRDALLFIDGIDEISNEELKDLVDDLSSWTSNSSFTRKLFLAGRTNEFNFETLNPLGKIERVYLRKPTSNEIGIIIDSSLDGKDDKLLVNDYIMTNFYDANLFFIEKTILFFKTKHKLPSALWELLDYVAGKDICHILRQEHPSLSRFEHEAFNAILLKKDGLSVAGRFIPLDSFAHRYIIEFLAAKYLTSLSAHDIWKKVSINGRFILPWLKNTVGLALSLISKEDKKKLNSLFSGFTRELFNIDALIKCDSLSLDKALKASLIKTTTEYMLDSLDIYSFEKDYSRLFCDPSVKEENFAWLSSRIDNEQDISDLDTLFHIVFYLCHNNGSVIPKSFVDYLKSKLFKLIDRENNADYYGSVSSILYCMALLSDSDTFSSDEITGLIDFISNKYWKHECFNNICRIITKTDVILSLSDFRKLIDVHFQIADFTRKRSGAYSVPQQIDDSFDPIPMEYQHTDDFYPLAEKEFIANPASLWSTMQLIVHLYQKESDRYPLEEKEEKLLKAIASSIMGLLKTTDLKENEISLILDAFMICPYSGNPLRSALIENAQNLVEILFLLVLDEWDNPEFQIKYHSVFRPFVFKIAKDRSLFLDIVSKQEFSKEEFENKIQIINYIDSPDSDTFRELSENSKEIVRQSIADRYNYEKNRKDHEELISSSVHQLFDKQTLIMEIRKVFSAVEKESVSTEDIFNIERKDNFSLYNNELSPIFLFFLEELLHGKESLSLNAAIDFWQENYKWKTILILVNYMKLHKLDYSLLNKDEQDFIKTWAVEAIKEHPIINGNDQLRYPHIYLSILMNDPFMENVLRNSLYSLREKFMGFISIGILRMLHSGVVAPEYASIDYLKAYFSDSEIIAHISNNMDHVLKNRNSMYGIGKYLSEIIITDTDQIYDLSTIKLKVTEHIRLHFSEFELEFNSFEPFLENAGITSDVFPVQLYLDSLKFNEKEQRYDYNHAFSFLKILRPCTEKERAHSNIILKKRFNHSNSIKEKKWIAEHLMMYDHSYHKSFNWYAELLLKDDSTTINETITHNEHYYCNSLLCLLNLKKLWVKYEHKNGEKSSAIRSIISNSVINIVKDSKHKRIAFFIIMRFVGLLGKTSDPYRIIRLKQQCILVLSNSLESAYKKKI